MTYDEAITKLEELVLSMEEGDALTIDEYKQKAKEAKKLIQFCQQQITGLENEIKEALQ